MNPHSQPNHSRASHASASEGASSGTGGGGAIHALMSGLVDYAGLFPPAKLAMAASVEKYAQYAAGEYAWMLGRFILPVSKIEEFRKAAAGVLPRQAGEEPWLISAIIDGDLDENLDSIFAFNHEHAQAKNGLANIDAAEIKVPMPGDAGLDAAALTGAAFIDDAIERMPEEVYPFFELPVLAPKGQVAPDLRGCIATLAGADGAAKVRTGGLVPEAIPSSRAVAEFLCGCHAADVPFKATAGLHHAVRAEYDLTYEKGCPRSIMHGFVNVFVAASMLHALRIDVETVTKILEERDPKKFVFDASGIRGGGGSLAVDTAQIERAREVFALSYGSCSFEEPLQELQGLGLV